MCVVGLSFSECCRVEMQIKRLQKDSEFAVTMFYTQLNKEQDDAES